MIEVKTPYETLKAIAEILLYDKYFHLEMFIDDNRDTKELTKEELEYIARQYINYHKMTGELPLIVCFDFATSLILGEVTKRFDYKGKAKEQEHNDD